MKFEAAVGDFIDDNHAIDEITKLAFPIIMGSMPPQVQNTHDVLALELRCIEIFTYFFPCISTKHYVGMWLPNLVLLTDGTY